MAAKVVVVPGRPFWTNTKAASSGERKCKSSRQFQSCCIFSSFDILLQFRWQQGTHLSLLLLCCCPSCLNLGSTFWQYLCEFQSLFYQSRMSFLAYPACVLVAYPAWFIIALLHRRALPLLPNHIWVCVRRPAAGGIFPTVLCHQGRHEEAQQSRMHNGCF